MPYGTLINSFNLSAHVNYYRAPSSLFEPSFPLPRRLRLRLRRRPTTNTMRHTPRRPEESESSAMIIIYYIITGSFRLSILLRRRARKKFNIMCFYLIRKTARIGHGRGLGGRLNRPIAARTLYARANIQSVPKRPE